MEEEQIVSPRKEILKEEDQSERMADREEHYEYVDEDEHKESAMKVSTEKARGRIYLGESSLREGMERLFGKKKKKKDKPHSAPKKRKSIQARDQY